MTKKQEVSASPSAKPKPVALYSFPDAISQLIQGKKIHRQNWPASEFCLLKDGFLMIEKNGSHRWLVNDGDLLATDWVAV